MMDKLFDLKVQKHQAELIIQLLAHQKNDNAQQLARDLNERYVWNYRQSLIK